MVQWFQWLKPHKNAWGKTSEMDHLCRLSTTTVLVTLHPRVQHSVMFFHLVYIWPIIWSPFYLKPFLLSQPLTKSQSHLCAAEAKKSIRCSSTIISIVPHLYKGWLNMADYWDCQRTGNLQHNSNGNLLIFCLNLRDDSICWFHVFFNGRSRRHQVNNISSPRAICKPKSLVPWAMIK